jgi:hypothetical protein
MNGDIALPNGTENTDRATLRGSLYRKRDCCGFVCQLCRGQESCRLTGPGGMGLNGFKRGLHVDLIVVSAICVPCLPDSMCLRWRSMKCPASEEKVRHYGD